jgi:uncharacterized membrane protein
MLAMAGLIALAGCNTGTPGGPGATSRTTAGTTTRSSTIGLAEDTFSLTTPLLSTTIKQGESKVISIGIKRGKNFEDDVTLKFDGLPEGVTLDPARPVIKHGDTEAKVTIKAADSAAVGDFTAKLVGHPAKGADATHDLKITVQKK